MMVGEDDGIEAHVVHLIVNEEGEATGLRFQDLAIIDGAPQIAGEWELDLDFSETEMATRNVVKFKAGAELSKSAAVADTGDCDDNDVEICPGAASTRLVFVMDTGELAAAVLAGRGGGAGRVSLQTYEVAVTGAASTEGAIFFDSLGGEPVLAVKPPLLELSRRWREPPLLRRQPRSRVRR